MSVNISSDPKYVSYDLWLCIVSAGEIINYQPWTIWKCHLQEYGINYPRALPRFLKQWGIQLNGWRYKFYNEIALDKCITIVDIQYCFVYLFPIIFVSILSYPKLVFSCFASFDPFFLNCTRLLSIFHFFFQFISKTIKVNTRTTVEDIANVFMCRLTSIAIDLC